MKNFKDLSEVLLSAFNAYPNINDSTEKKIEILRTTTDPELSGSYLFVGFNPVCVDFGGHFYVTEVTDGVLDYLDGCDAHYTYVDLDDQADQSFDYVVAFDEYLTYADAEQRQLAMLQILAALASKKLITSLRDYKNQDRRDRDLSVPVSISGHGTKSIYLESHDHAPGALTWTSRIHEIQGTTAHHHGPYARMPMYFKQLARAAYDSGATGFRVERNLMYKGLVRKNFEHVITIDYPEAKD
jgi:hypothetical protein